MLALSRCPVCGSEEISLAYLAPTTRGIDRRQWSVSECNHCSHQFINPQPSWADLEGYYNSNYEAYDPMHGSQGNDDQEIAQAKRVGRFRHIEIPQGRRLLDVGCGAGWFLRIAKKLGAMEQGIEPNQHAARLAQEQGLRVAHGTLESYAQNLSTNTQFDIITANHVLEHVPKPVETLRTMKALLAPGGIIWIAVPNAAYPLCRALKGTWHSSDLPYHLMHFTPQSLHRAGREAGLLVKRQTTESLPGAVAASLGQYLRKTFFVPKRVTSHLPGLHLFAKHCAQRFDAKVIGEAILTEFIADKYDRSDL